MTLVEQGAPNATIDDEGYVREPGGTSWVRECDVASDFSNRWELANADYECVHGRLANDVCPSPRVVMTSGQFKGTVIQNWPHAHPCGCWPTELQREPRLPVPDLLSIFKKEPLMLIAAPERAALPPAEAPYGYKADGTPRKRPAPSPERVAKMLAGRGKPKPEPEPEPEPDVVRLALEAAANIEPAAPVRPTTVVHITASKLLTRIVADIDAEIARLEAAKAKLLGVVA